MTSTCTVVRLVEMYCRWGTTGVGESTVVSLTEHFFSSLQVNIETCLFRHFGPQKEKFSQGVTALQMLPSGKFLLGTGEGVVAEVTGAPHFKRLRTSRVPGAVTSVTLRGSGNQVWASHTHTHTHTHTCSLCLLCSSLLAWQRHRCTSLSMRALAPF